MPSPAQTARNAGTGLGQVGRVIRSWFGLRTKYGTTGTTIDKEWSKDRLLKGLGATKREDFVSGLVQKRHPGKGTISATCWRWQEKVHFCVLNKLHKILLTLEDSK